MNTRTQVPKEWKCNSKAYRRLYFILIVVFCLIAYLCWSTAQNPAYSTKFPHSLTFAYLSGGVAILFFLIYLKKAGNLKQVRFTPDAVYIGWKKVDLKYVQSIEFIDYIRMRQGSILGLHFRMAFKSNPIIKEDVHFSMEFYKSFFTSDLSAYDYDSDFINVVMEWVDRRK